MYIGSHGVDHEIHHADQPEAIRRRELSVSKQEIERWVGKPCIAFAYPNGDFIPESESELQHSGYQLGFTLVPRTVTRGTSPWYLPRIAPRNSFQSLAEDLFWETS
ncbi:MAG: polysaccharide deacetylase family protein [Anaerolineae bacterium]